MIKKFFVTCLLSIILLTNANAAGSGNDNTSSKVKSDYDKAIVLVKSAKKYEKKDKNDKAIKRYKKAQKLLLKSYNKKPDSPDTLNYLGFTTRKLGDYENGEKYYLEGLQLDPNHIGINEYLGELYVATGRHNLAVERLEVLKSCNCKEYDQLKAIIAGEEISKY